MLIMSFFILIIFRLFHSHIVNVFFILTVFFSLNHRFMLTKCKNHIFLTFFLKIFHFGTRFANVKMKTKVRDLFSLCKLFELVDLKNHFI
jgi:hypothetical protein